MKASAGDQRNMRSYASAPAASASAAAAATVDDDVLFTTNNALRVVTLNRPKALNSLTLSMVRKIMPALQVRARRRAPAHSLAADSQGAERG